MYTNARTEDVVDEDENTETQNKVSEKVVY